MNRRPPGYEPDELPDCSTPRQYKKVGGEGFEPSKLSQQIYSLPPLAARESTHNSAVILVKKRTSESTINSQNRIAYCHNQYSIERR